MRTLTAFIIIAIMLVAATSPAPQAQEKTPPPEKKRECGTVVPPGAVGAQLALKARAITAAAQMNPPTDAPYYLPLTIHIVRRSDGTGGMTLEQLALALRDLNRLWQPLGVQFFMPGQIDYINNDTHFNVPDVQANRDALRGVNPRAGTINIHFTNLASLCGQASFTNMAVQGVLMDIACAGVTTNPSTLAHEIGHYFDLFHTHETFPDAMGNPTRVECPSGNNCSTAGDFLCDTPADPDLGGRVNADCSYNNSATTPAACDTTAYNPPTRNMMADSLKTCRDQFTAGQINKVLQTLRDTANRRNLIISGTRYVDPLASVNNADCSYNFPCHSVTKAIQLALRGDTIFIKPATYRAPLLPGGKQVTLTRWGTGGGVVQILP